MYGMIWHNKINLVHWLFYGIQLIITNCSKLSYDFAHCTLKHQGKTMKMDAICALEHAKNKGKKRRTKRSHKHKLPELNNPWPYVDVLPILAENTKVTRDEISTLECHGQYSIKTRPDTLSENEKMTGYIIFLEN